MIVKDIQWFAAMSGTSLFIGALTAYSTDAWTRSHERGSQELSMAKTELLGADLLALHHAVCSEVGESRWEREVKPRFLSRLTWATVRETGNVFPDWKDIVKWAREHPEESRRMLLSSKAP